MSTESNKNLTDMIKKMYTPKEVAEILDVTRRTVYREIDRGNLSATKVGGSWRIPYSALEKYVGEDLLKELLPEEG